MKPPKATEFSHLDTKLRKTSQSINSFTKIKNNTTTVLNLGKGGGVSTRSLIKGGARKNGDRNNLNFPQILLYYDKGYPRIARVEIRLPDQ